jgi:hypothetical protein
MKLSDIAEIIRGLRARMPESSRTLLANKFVTLFGKNLTDSKDGDKLQAWVDAGGPTDFYDQCDLHSDLPWVHHEISVHDSDLATFINRWMNVDEFKRKGEGFVPITPDMNSIRCMMVEELKGLYEAQKRVTDHDEEGLRKIQEAEQARISDDTD